MKWLAAFGFGGRERKRDVSADLRALLPTVNSFVEVAVGDTRRRSSVAVNEVSPNALIVRALRGLVVGKEADFVYTTLAGRFRFVATCAKIEDGEAHFHLPVSVRTVEVFHSRGAQRVLKLLDAQWRYAPDGRGYGEFLPASIMDLSSGGASLVVDRAPKPGSQVEVRFTLESINKTFLEVCEVARSARIAASAKNAAGIRFLTMDPRDERALTNFLRDVQIERRDRGLM